LREQARQGAEARLAREAANAAESKASAANGVSAATRDAIAAAGRVGAAGEDTRLNAQQVTSAMVGSAVEVWLHNQFGEDIAMHVRHGIAKGDNACLWNSLVQFRNCTQTYGMDPMTLRSEMVKYTEQVRNSGIFTDAQWKEMLDDTEVCQKSDIKRLSVDGQLNAWVRHHSNDTVQWGDGLCMRMMAMQWDIPLAAIALPHAGIQMHNPTAKSNQLVVLVTQGNCHFVPMFIDGEKREWMLGKMRLWIAQAEFVLEEHEPDTVTPLAFDAEAPVPHAPCLGEEDVRADQVARHLALAEKRADAAEKRADDAAQKIQRTVAGPLRAVQSGLDL
jgi:hypothetical protein